MNKVAIVSCDNWKGKIKEDIYLNDALIKLGIISQIISWEDKDVDFEGYDALILRSVWGYQNKYKEFKEWLLEIQKRKIKLYNSPSIVLNNILKDRQFELLKINKIDCIPTFFIDNLPNFEIQINEIIDNCFSNRDVVIKPTISGSGESTYLLSCKGQFNLPNTILKDEIKSRFIDILSKNEDCKIMLQPYIPEIINGEYSCIFIDGELTHTMLRFPNIFHEKIRTRIELNPPLEVLNMAKKIESISAFNGYLYMRVDMVIVNGMPLVMEVELAEPDLLTKYIDNPLKRNEVINKLSKRLVKRI